MKRLVTGVLGVAMAAAASPSLEHLRCRPWRPIRMFRSRWDSRRTGLPCHQQRELVGVCRLHGHGTFSSVCGKWQVPTATCLGTPDESHVFWVGLDGFGSGTVEQGGTYAICEGTTPLYFAWWEMYPTNDITVVYAVYPGDFIAASVVYAKGSYKITVSDTTPAHATNFSTTQTCASNVTCARASAEWIAEAPTYGTTIGNLAEWTNTKGQNQIGFYAGFATPTGGKKAAMGAAPGLWQVAQVGASGTLAAPGNPGSQKQGFQDYWYAES